MSYEYIGGLAPLQALRLRSLPPTAWGRRKTLRRRRVPRGRLVSAMARSLALSGPATYELDDGLGFSLKPSKRLRKMLRKAKKGLLIGATVLAVAAIPGALPFAGKLLVGGGKLVARGARGIARPVASIFRPRPRTPGTLPTMPEVTTAPAYETVPIQIPTFEAPMPAPSPMEYGYSTAPAPGFVAAPAAPTVEEQVQAAGAGAPAAGIPPVAILGGLALVTLMMASGRRR